MAGLLLEADIGNSLWWPNVLIHVQDVVATIFGPQFTKTIVRAPRLADAIACVLITEIGHVSASRRARPDLPTAANYDPLARQQSGPVVDAILPLRSGRHRHLPKWEGVRSQLCATR
jgi:hypothetical protein